MADYQSTQISSFVKGVNASASKTNQPQGSVPRASNLLLTRRGSLITCDGSLILHSFNGVPTAGRGRMMATFLFSPTGVSRYYMAIAKALDIALGAPNNLSVATAAGGTLAAATYFYVVTAIDGVGGETLASNEVSQVTPANNKNTLTWNVVPNATGYKVYRGTVASGEGLLISSTLPVSQVGSGTLTVTFVDDGTGSVATIPIATATSNFLGNQAIYTTTVPHNLVAGQIISIAGNTDAVFNGANKTIRTIISSTQFLIQAPFNTFPYLGHSGTGGTITPAATPTADTTQQTALFKMPLITGSPATLPVSYNNTNIVAFFPADDRPSPDGGGGGGSGGGGGTGGGGTTGGGSTASGGVPGNVSFIPEMVQFSNRLVIALGNGFPAQLFSDPSTLTNPATTSTITAISVDAFGVVTVTVAVGHSIPAGGDGANVLISGLSGALSPYNGTFVTIKRISATQFSVRNLAAIGLGAGATGTVVTTTVPLISTFTQAFPIWATGVTYLVGDLITPTVANGHYYKAIQGGISAAGQPVFPIATGAQVQEATPSKVIWQEAGLTSSTSPPPQAIAHCKVFAGSLWAWNTAPTNTANGLDGPTSLRMSDSNNPNSWNPVNQAFLDKDDGSEGSGLSPFTISGFGIPPEGSLVAFKQWAGYQIVGVFGSPQFLIQRIKSNLGCTAPRTLQFTTGYGLTRFSHLGFAVFDGMNDRVIDEDIRPYIFPSNNIEVRDITSVDYSWVSIAWAAQTAYPPMYVAAMPIGNSGGKLSRMFCYDLVLKAWVIVDLPFAIGTLMQAFTNIATPVTVLGSFDDGTLHRWQSGDDQWDNSIDSPGPSAVAWSVEAPLVQNKSSQGGRIYVRQVVVRGQLTDATATLASSLELQGEPAVSAGFQQVNYGTDGTFSMNIPVNEKVTNMSPIISGTGAVEVSNIDVQIKPEVAVVPGRLT